MEKYFQKLKNKILQVILSEIFNRNNLRQISVTSVENNRVAHRKQRIKVS